MWNALPIHLLLPSSGQCMVGTDVTSCVSALLFRDQQAFGGTRPCQWLSLLPVSVTGLSSFRHTPVPMKTLYVLMFSWAVYLIFSKCPWKCASCGEVTWRACSGWVLSLGLDGTCISFFLFFLCFELLRFISLSLCK